MSFILDALKRSERERQTDSAPFGSAAPSHIPNPSPPWAWLAIGIAATLVVIGVLWIAFSRAPAPAASAPATPKVRDLTEQLVAEPAPTASVAARPASPNPAARAETGEIPFLRSLPDELRRSLPEMVVNIHVYTPDESQRLLYVNNRQYRRGEFIGGVLIEDITPDGVLVNYHGVRFKLERPR